MPFGDPRPRRKGLDAVTDELIDPPAFPRNTLTRGPKYSFTRNTSPFGSFRSESLVNSPDIGKQDRHVHIDPVVKSVSNLWHGRYTRVLRQEALNSNAARSTLAASLTVGDAPLCRGVLTMIFHIPNAERDPNTTGRETPTSATN